MTPEQQILWEKIRNLELDDPNAAFMFSDRLARENGWSLEYSLQAVHEYKKFIFLLCIASHPLTPSDQVDQVWHLHLLYTHSYWTDMCRNTLGRDIHHGPTKGGQAEKDKFEDWYARTLELYQRSFHQPPPPTIWPDSETRFSQIHFQRVNTDTHWVIRKPKLFQK